MMSNVEFFNYKNLKYPMGKISHITKKDILCIFYAVVLDANKSMYMHSKV